MIKKQKKKEKKIQKYNNKKIQKLSFNGLKLITVAHNLVFISGHNVTVDCQNCFLVYI